jgi:hypothetical protein
MEQKPLKAVREEEMDVSVFRQPKNMGERGTEDCPGSCLGITAPSICSKQERD